ncbi:hypothetical protein DRJ17_05940 [Candidatus Woesearchaeota archaeon]|nr:MAG: hypothetical protein DRJ17_05940 [Candidatus Woesearchaeota archaeon]
MIRKCYFFIFVLLFANLLFSIESTSFDLGEITLYKFGDPDLSHHNISTDASIDFSFRASTGSIVLDALDPTDLEEGDSVCPGTIDLDFTSSGGTWADSTFFAGAVFPIGWWNGGGMPFDCPSNSFNQISIWNESLYNTLQSVMLVYLDEPLFGSIPTDSDECATYYYNEATTPPSSVTNKLSKVSMICKGDVTIYVNGAPVDTVTFEEIQTTIQSISDTLSVGTYLIEADLGQVNCMYTLRTTNTKEQPGDKATKSIYKYADPSGGHLYSYNPPDRIGFTLFIEYPEILIDAIYVTEVGSSIPGVVINPGQSKPVDVHLLLNTTSMAFNVTDIQITPSTFTFVPDDSYPIFIPEPGAFDVVIPGTLTAPDPYIETSLNFEVFYNTTLPVCDDQTGSDDGDTPIIQGPDLVASITSSGAGGIIYAIEGDVVTFDVNTSNIGSLPTVNDTITRVISTDRPDLFSPLEFDVFAPFADGATQINQYTFTCPMGVNQNLSFEVCADAYDTENDEINEDNNCGNITLVCEAYPNLIAGRPVVTDCVVNETNTVIITTRVGNICTENATWTNASFKDASGTIINSSLFSVPPMPNTQNPNFAPGNPVLTLFPDDWGVCIDFGEYKNITHRFEFTPPAEGTYTISNEVDYGNLVDEGIPFDFVDNLQIVTFNCAPPAPGDITPFCEDIYLNGTGYNEEGVLGATNSGSDPVDVDFNVIGSGNVAPAPFDFWRTNITINGSSDYSELINWKCEADSWRSTYNVIVSWTDAIGDHSESVMCEVWCEVPLYCEDYL